MTITNKSKYILKAHKHPTKDNKLLNWLKNNLLEYFFYVLDLRQYPNETKIWSASIVDNENNLEYKAIILEYHNNIQIRGEKKAIEELLTNYRFKGKFITFSENVSELVKRYFPTPEINFKMYRMLWKNSDLDEINNNEKYKKNKKNIEKLNAHDKKEIATLMRKADPVFWREQTTESIKINDNNIWFGIKINNKLVSVSSIWIDEIASVISIVATDPEHWRKGLAYRLITDILKNYNNKTPIIIIHVRTDNYPAVNLYQKVGFKIVKTFELLKY